MLNELATFTTSAGVTVGQTTVDGGTANNPPITSGRVLSFSGYVQAGVPTITFYGQDQSLQAHTITGAIDGPTQAALLVLLKALGQAKITALSAGTTITFTAG